MSQAEIASAVLSPEGTYPTKGTRFRDFTLWSDADKRVSLSDFRGRKNVILLFAGLPTEHLVDVMEGFTAYHEQLEDLNACVAIVLALPLTELGHIKRPAIRDVYLFSDPDRAVHKAAGALNEHEMPAPALYVLDRYAEIFAAFRTRDGQRIPEVREMIRWLEFIEAQCPECEAPEWPV